MAVVSRVSYIGLVQVKADGTVIRRSGDASTLKDHLVADTVHRILDSSGDTGGSPNSVNYPTLSEYLALEAAEDFQLMHLSQFVVVTNRIT